MNAFTDNDGRGWNVTLDPAAIERVRRQCGVRLSPPRQRIMDRIGSDPALFARVLYAICEPQVIAREMTPEQFAAALAGCAERAIESTISSLIMLLSPADRYAVRAQMSGGI